MFVCDILLIRENTAGMMLVVHVVAAADNPPESKEGRETRKRTRKKPNMYFKEEQDSRKIN